MATYTQSERPLQITTPLGKDVLLLTSLKGHESISQLFHFDLELHAEVGSVVKFEKILGQAVTIRMDLTNGDKRYFNGLVRKFSQAGRNDLGFGKFRAEVVPAFWTLSRKIRCRTFQHLSVPEILRQVLIGFDVSFRLIGTYPPRDYCVQYRESDFDFASRLMEEEGISYYFQHADGSHTMIVADRLSLPVEGQTSAIYDSDEGAVATDMRVTEWEKTQTLLSGEFTFWDHCFEIPGNHLEAKKKLTETIVAGTVPHKLRLPANETWEIYDYPGAYARRFDGIDSAGTPQQSGIQHIFEDRSRAIQIRMQQEETASLDIRGESYCGNFSAGLKFQLKRHFDADGEYFLTSVEHEAKLEDHQTGEVAAFNYTNSFHCIPATMHFRPELRTKKPVIPGIQTATVVGPPGEEIFVDMYGRVKVQFHWDREGKMDASSSCWLRVSQFWAGKGWGAFFWPRIGHEVIVAFEEGDPDQPIVMGSVYNRENMPFYSLPFCKDFAGIKSESCRGNQHENYNAVVLVDRKGEEHLAIHSERHLVFNAETDVQYKTGRHHGERVPLGKTVTVGRLPGFDGGGSGGTNVGVSPPTTEPQPAAFLGLNSTSVYGANVQTAFPLNYQMTTGSNIQLCINPAGLAYATGLNVDMDEGFTKLMGGGLGGNIAFTLGANTTFVVGPTFDINLGPTRMKINTNEGPSVTVTSFCAWCVVACCGVQLGCYLAAKRDADRSAVVLLCTTMVEYFLACMVACQQLKFDSDDQGDHHYHSSAVAVTGEQVSETSTRTLVSAAAGIAVTVFVVMIAAIIVADVLMLTGETDLEHKEKADEDQANSAAPAPPTTASGTAFQDTHSGM